jgi:hypothetical protein
MSISKSDPGMVPTAHQVLATSNAVTCDAMVTRDSAEHPAFSAALPRPGTTSSHIGVSLLTVALVICLLAAPGLAADAGPERFGAVDSWRGEFEGTDDVEIQSEERGIISQHGKLSSGKIELSNRNEDVTTETITWTGTATARLSVKNKVTTYLFDKNKVTGECGYTEEANEQVTGTAVLKIALTSPRYHLEIVTPHVVAERVMSCPRLVPLMANSHGQVNVSFDGGTFFAGTLPTVEMTLHDVATDNPHSVPVVGEGQPPAAAPAMGKRMEWTLKPSTCTINVKFEVRDVSKDYTIKGNVNRINKNVIIEDFDTVAEDENGAYQNVKVKLLYVHGNSEIEFLDSSGKSVPVTERYMRDLNIVPKEGTTVSNGGDWRIVPLSNTQDIFSWDNHTKSDPAGLKTSLPLTSGSPQGSLQQFLVANQKCGGYYYQQLILLDRKTGIARVIQQDGKKLTPKEFEEAKKDATSGAFHSKPPDQTIINSLSSGVVSLSPSIHDTGIVSIIDPKK